MADKKENMCIFCNSEMKKISDIPAISPKNNFKILSGYKCTKCNVTIYNTNFAELADKLITNQ